MAEQTLADVAPEDQQDPEDTGHPNLLTLTAAAVSRIKGLQSTHTSDRMAVRVTVRDKDPEEFHYSVYFVPEEERTPEDELVRTEGILIYLDQASAHRIMGSTLDFVETVQAGAFRFENPNKPKLLDNPLAARVQLLLVEKINPAVAEHGGRVRLVRIQGSKVYLAMEGSCDGCSMVDVTLKEGIEATLRDEIPEISEVVDATEQPSDADSR